MPEIQFRDNIPLREWGSYHIGGPSRYFFEARSIEEIQAALAVAKDKNLPVFILGNGTNLLINDKGFNGLVIKQNVQGFERDGHSIHAGAGATMKELLAYTIQESLSGLEWAGGLPGTVGGAVRGNAGCFGGEMKDVIERVVSMDVETGEVRERSGEECRFGYRMSVFKELQGREIIISATISLKEGDKEAIQKAIQEKIIYREEHHPLEYPNIGSIFKNVPLTQIYKKGTQEYLESQRTSACSLRGSALPVKQDPFPVVPTAYLIAEAGMKEKKVGSAMVSPKHPNFIVNLGTATSGDVEALITFVKSAVQEKFGIILEEEVQRL